MTPVQYAEHRGVTRQAVHKAIVDGRITTVNGLIDQDLADRDWMRPDGDSEGPVAGDEGHGPDLGRMTREGRAMYAVWRGRRERLAFERDSGQLADREQMRRAGLEAATHVRMLFEGLGRAVIPRLEAAATRAERQRIIDDHVRELLEELGRRAERAAAGGAARLDDAPPPAPDTAAAPAPRAPARPPRRRR